MYRHTLTLFFLCLPASLFAQQATDGRFWLQMAQVGQQADRLGSCVPPKFGSQLNLFVHMAFFQGLAEADARSGKAIDPHGKGPDDWVAALDALYKDPANLHIPIYDAYRHAGLQFSGAPSAVVSADLAKLRKANP